MDWEWKMLSAPFFLVALAACGDFVDDYETEHLRIKLTSGNPVMLCNGDLVLFEHQISTLQDSFGLTLKRGVKVELHNDSGNTPGKFAKRDNRIVASRNQLVHELVHAMSADDDADAFFVEGIAAGFDGEVVLFPIAVSLPSENLGRRNPDYAVAAHFFRWLVATHGMQAGLGLLAGDSFVKATGASIVEAEQLWLAEAPWAYPPLDDCPYDKLPPSNDGWAAEVSLACDEPSVTTVAWDEIGSRRSCRTFEVVTPGFYDVESQAFGSLKRCVADPVREPEAVDRDRLPSQGSIINNVYPVPPTNNPVYFDAGRYAVCLEQSMDDEAGAFEVAVRPTATTGVRP